MINIQALTFNPFQENTYILSDESRECIIIDPGCCNPEEEKELEAFIANHKLTPVKLVNTHAHIDHVLGNRFVSGKWNLLPEMHEKDLPVLASLQAVGMNFGIHIDTPPQPKTFLKERDQIRFGNSVLDVLFTPGHSPGSISLYSKSGNFVIAGDVLFLNSIGRTDLPGGNHETLLQSIRKKLFVLGDDVNVYPGHGPLTTIGYERRSNPFCGELS